VTAEAKRMPDGSMAAVPNTEEERPCDLVILAMGFIHPDQTIPNALRLDLDGRRNIATQDYATSVPGT
jgi:glutamate synthase (NADPH/NADH) small chain